MCHKGGRANHRMNPTALSGAQIGGPSRFQPAF